MPFAIEMLNITKKFGNITANDNITLRVEKGQIHALLGENGAGKSTLMSILFGLYQMDSGEIKVNGEVANINFPNDAVRYKIGMVHQHFKLVEVFSVLENIILGREETSKFGFLKTSNNLKKIEELIEKFQFDINPHSLIKDLSIGAQQKVEILKMLYQGADILIFDEPTAVLTPQEIDSLFKIIKQFAAEGKTVIIITHKLDEIKNIADTCTVIRKGKYIGEVSVPKTTTAELAKLMVGREVVFSVKKKPATPGKTILQVNNLTQPKEGLKKVFALKDVSFDIKAGEVLGVVGIEGNGQNDLVKSIMGINKIKSGQGTITFNDQDITHSSIKNRIESGISYIPEDRHNDGLILSYSLEYNEILGRLNDPRFVKKGVLQLDYIEQYTTEIIKKFDVRSSGTSKGPAKALSGGNQQKLIISREMEKPHDLLIAFQPTRGLDVGAIEYIHSNIIKERDSGKAVLLVSYELDEILSLADRVIVLYKGQIVARLDVKGITHHQLGEYMLGSKSQIGVNNEK